MPLELDEIMLTTIRFADEPSISRVTPENICPAQSSLLAIVPLLISVAF